VPQARKSGGHAGIGQLVPARMGKGVWVVVVVVVDGYESSCWVLLGAAAAAAAAAESIPLAKPSFVTPYNS
jgi:hypothetical protein